MERPGIRLAAGAQNALAREQALEAWTQPLYGRSRQRARNPTRWRQPGAARGHLLSAADLRVGTGAGSGLIPARRSKLFGSGDVTVAGHLPQAAGGRIRLDEAFDPTGVRGDQRRERRWTIAEARCWMSVAMRFPWAMRGRCCAARCARAEPSRLVVHWTGKTGTTSATCATGYLVVIEARARLQASGASTWL